MFPQFLLGIEFHSGYTLSPKEVWWEGRWYIRSPVVKVYESE